MSHKLTANIVTELVCRPWVGDINMGWPDPAWKRSGTSFLARCLIETASSRRGETTAGCGSIAAFRSFPAKRDMSRSISHRVMCGFPRVLCGKRQRHQAA